MPTLSPLQKEQKSDAMVSLDIWTNDSPMAVSRRDWLPQRPAVLIGERTLSWVVVSSCRAISASAVPCGLLASR